jgi:hypothetical protein
MGTSVRMIDRTYGHFARDAHDAILDRLNAARAQPGVLGDRRVRPETAGSCW